MVNNFSDFDITNAKLDEFNTWKTHKVYDSVDNCNENGVLNFKVRLVAKGFWDDNPDILCDSPTCSKESMRLVKPPKEVDCQDTTLWKLNSTIYRLNDASISWYLNVKKELIGLGVIYVKSDPAVFICHTQSKTNGLLCTDLDDFLFGGTELFLNKVFNPIKHVFTIGSEHCTAFNYLGLNISQSNLEIMIDEVNYIKSVDNIAISNDRKKQKYDLLCKEENDNIRTLVWQLDSITGQTRPDLAFEVCQLSSILNHSKVDGILKAFFPFQQDLFGKQ